MKPAIVKISFFFLLLIAVEATAAKDDSLKIKQQLIGTDISPDQKVSYLNDLCFHYRTIDADTSLYYGWLGLPVLKNRVTPFHAGFLHFALGMAWENKGNPDSARWYLNKAAWILKGAGDSLLYSRAVEQQGSLYRISANSEKELAKSRLLIMGLIFILFVLLIIVLLVYFAFRHKRALQNGWVAEQRSLQLEQENRLKDTEIEKSILEQKLKQEEVEKLQLEIELKEQDLVYQILLRTDLSQVNRSVHEKLGHFQYRLTRKKDQDDFIQTLAEITRETSRDPMVDFEMIFRQMHGGFYEKLLEKCPDLTKTELQVCALLRLNLTSKDISRLVNISSSTVDLIRHKIRKKIGLDQKESLTSYLIML